jgi:hypothetical protein
MPQTPDDAYSRRIRNIADNLSKELERLAMGTPWRDAVRFVDLLAVAQTVYAIEPIEPAEGKEAHALRAAATRLERLLRRKRDKLSRENPFMTEGAKARFDEDLEVVRRYTHCLDAEARVALAVRDALDRANDAYRDGCEIPTGLGDGPLVELTCAALEYAPSKSKTRQALRRSLEKWPVLRR